MKKNEFFKGLTRIFTDFFSGVLAWFLAYYLRPWTDLIPNVHYLFPIENLPEMDFFLLFVFFSCCGLLVILSSVGMYRYPVRYLTFDVARNLLWALLLWMLSIVAVYSLVLHDHIFSRVMLAHALIFTFVFILGFRGVLRVLFEKIFRGKKSICMVGTSDELKKLESSLENSEYTDIEKVNIVDKKGAFEMIRSDKVSEIFFFERGGEELFLNEVRNISAASGKILHIIPQYASEFFGYVSFSLLRGFPLLTTVPFREKTWWSFFKRLFDIGFSILFLVFFSPLFFIIGVCIKIESGDWKAPVFYISQRVGRNGKLFSIWKFRSMVLDADKKKKELKNLSHRNGPLFKIKDDPRITRVGKFLRKTSLDEIPQFINVIKGEMSVIGPRPHLESELKEYSSVQKRVLASKPGISGLSQVSGRSDLSFEEEISLDSFYTENSGFFLDMKIFLKTPFVLLFGKGND